MKPSVGCNHKTSCFVVACSYPCILPRRQPETSKLNAHRLQLACAADLLVGQTGRVDSAPQSLKFEALGASIKCWYQAAVMPTVRCEIAHHRSPCPKHNNGISTKLAGSGSIGPRTRGVSFIKMAADVMPIHSRHLVPPLPPDLTTIGSRCLP